MTSASLYCKTKTQHSYTLTHSLRTLDARERKERKTKSCVNVLVFVLSFFYILRHMSNVKNADILSVEYEPCVSATQKCYERSASVRSSGAWTYLRDSKNRCGALSFCYAMSGPHHSSTWLGAPFRAPRIMTCHFT